MARKPPAIGRFVVEIQVPEDELRPTVGGMLVALEEGLQTRGYRILVRSVTPEPGVPTWSIVAEERRPDTPTAARV